MPTAGRCTPVTRNWIGRETPHAQLWHAITLLREYRGDGHIAALVTHGLSGIEALITHVATGTGFDPEFGRNAARLEPRAVGRSGRAIARAGPARRRRPADGRPETNCARKVEDLTDELAYAPWRDGARRRCAGTRRAGGGHPGRRARRRGFPDQRVRPAVRAAPLVGVLVELADRRHTVDTCEHGRRVQDAVARQRQHDARPGAVPRGSPCGSAVNSVSCHCRRSQACSSRLMTPCPRCR